MVLLQGLCYVVDITMVFLTFIGIFDFVFHLVELSRVDERGLLLLNLPLPGIYCWRFHVAGFMLFYLRIIFKAIDLHSYSCSRWIWHWIFHFHSMGLFLYREILCYPTPINFNYWYGIGLLLVFLLVNQVLTGIQVGSYYIVSIDVALSSVDYLMREITYGWSFRYLH